MLLVLKGVCYVPKIVQEGYVTHTIHVWYIYLHLPYKSTIHVSKQSHGWCG